jgi:hypothetical protein
VSCSMTVTPAKCVNEVSCCVCVQADAVFMSPPWGGPAYAAATFDVTHDVGGLGFGLSHMLSTAASMLSPGAHPLRQSLSSRYDSELITDD